MCMSKDFSRSVKRCAKCLRNFVPNVGEAFVPRPGQMMAKNRGTDAAPTFKIREMPQEERPREKLATHGPASLTNPELIAILLRTGVIGANAIEVARELLETY